MQTFLPFPDFKKSLDCLDYRRLGKQRVESKQILNILQFKTNSKAWVNHPAVLMWKGYEESLKLYFNYSIDLWIKKGYKNTLEKFQIDWDNFEFPFWFGLNIFHLSHQSNLLRKDFSFYSQKFQFLNPNLPYYWPVMKGN